jgi:hypothetical protein
MKSSPFQPQRLYFKEGEPGKDGTEAGQTEKTEKGRTKNEKKRFTPPKHSRRLVRPQRFFPYVVSLNMMC